MRFIKTTSPMKHVPFMWQRVMKKVIFVIVWHFVELVVHQKAAMLKKMLRSMESLSMVRLMVYMQ